MQKRSVVIILLILLFATSVFVFNFTSIPILSNLAQMIAEPPKRLFYQLRTSGDGNTDKKLLDENAQLRQKIVDYERLKRDNDALRGQFEEGETRQFELLPARILGSQGSLFNPSGFIVNQGKKSGVEPGMAVVLQNNLLGRVEAVSDNYSKVSLTRNQKFSTLSRASQTNALGMARGKGDFILLDQVSINDKLEKGQLLLTRGQINENGFGVPPDLIIGKIISVNRNESLPTQSAKVEIIIDVSRVDLIFIIIK